MKKKTLFISVFLFIFSYSYSQTLLTNDYRTAIQIGLSQENISSEYRYNNTILTPEENHLQSDRLRLSQGSSYFSFILPETGETTISIDLENYQDFGLAIYIKETSNEYTFWGLQTFENQNHGQIKVPSSENFAEHEVICRFWQISQASQGKIYIGINAQENPTGPNNTRVVSVNSNLTPTQLVGMLITGCLTASNISYTGDDRAIGYFTTDSNEQGVTVGISEGVIISSGKASDAGGPNINVNNNGTTLNKPGNSILNSLLPNTGLTPSRTLDAAVLEFDFKPSSDHIEFQYVFASDEYPRYAPPQPSTFNDIFAFVISGGPENYNNTNIAIVPGTTNTPVSINNINAVTNSHLYVANYSIVSASPLMINNGGPNVEYNGLTTVLTASCNVTACETYNIKLMIADVQDGKYDSAVFLKSNSFTSGESFSYEAQNTWAENIDIYRGCDGFLKFCRMPNSDYEIPIEVTYTIGGSAMEGSDYTQIPLSIIIPAETPCVEVPFTALDNDGTVEVELILDFLTGCPCNLEESQLKISILPELDPTASLTNSGPICAGETATINLNLESSDNSLISVVWSNQETNVNSISVSPTTTTTYTVELSYPCGTKSLSTTVEVAEMPVVNLGPDIEIQGAATTVLTASLTEGNTGIWTVLNNPEGVTIHEPTNPITSVTVQLSGEYQFTWTETSLAPNCIASDDIIVKFMPGPNAEFEVSMPDCFEDNISVTFTGETTSPNPTFSWDFGNATVISGSGQGPYEIHYPNPGNHTIQITVNEYGLPSSNSRIVYVPEKVKSELITNNDKCFNSCLASAKINVTGGSQPYSYSWDSENNELSNLCKGSYSVTVSDSKGCSISEDFEISEPEEISLSFTTSNLECFNDNSGQISINANGGSSPYSYIWSDGGANSAIRSNLAAGDYSVVIKDKNDCSIDKDFNLVQPEKIEISITEDFSICEGESVEITATSTGGLAPLTYYWAKGEDISQAPEDFNIGETSLSTSPTESTTYTVYTKDYNNCKSDYVFCQVKVSSDMKVDISLEHIKCKGECSAKAILDITGGIRPFTYSWNTNIPILTDICAGEYQVIITDGHNCSKSIDFTIEEPETEIEAEIVSTNAKCSDSEDGSIQIIASGGTSPYQYQWSINSSNHTITAGAGTYFATITDLNNCSKNISETIYAPDKLEVIHLADRILCIGASTTVSTVAIGGTEPYTYQWIGDNGEIHSSNEFSTSPTKTCEYELLVTDKNNCTNQEGKIKININPPITIGEILSETNNVCKGGKVLLDAYISGGDGGPYIITDNNGNIINFPYTYYPEESGNFTISVKDNCETPAEEKSIYITVSPFLEINFSADILQACPYTNIKFSPYSSQEIQSYHWEVGNSAFSENPEFSHLFIKDGFYDVSLTATGTNGCTNKISKKNYIQIHKKPEAIFIPSPESAGIHNPSINFTNQSQGNIYNFWDFGDNNSLKDVKNPRHIYNALGEYQVRLICENSFGCKDTCTRIVNIRDEFTIYAPTAFTPNGDGINDCFRICANGINESTYNLRVYNRWGELVFFTDKYFPDANCSDCGQGAWDGTHKSKSNSNKPLPAGTYTWFANFKDFNNVDHEYSGTINIIR